MDNYYITKTTKSIVFFSKAFEELLPGSTVSAESSSKNFKSFGEGIISENFYIGNNVTECIDNIEIINSTSCILTLPRTGVYSTEVSNKLFEHVAGKSGGIVLPTNRIFYKSAAGIIDDLSIVVDMNELKPILKKSYNVCNIPNHYIPLDLKNGKVSAVYKFIESTILTAKNFPHLGESLLVKSDIKEMAIIFIADLIADALGISTKDQVADDLILVRKTEELMESECKRLFTINEIAEQLDTSPRNLQKAFKKYRDYTPLQFLKNKKLKEAYHLLTDDNDPNMSVKKAALSVGINDLSRFSRYYKEMYGELPSETVSRKRK